ncbi:histidinol phosphatase [Salinimicrobium tongyeongense]|uniref:protein-tyrosine-phosphatase n=1 Tax=Salinimicrobium tongyeongense TaxID=2809707 RepID=A0ABY6NRN2_9FLAO|nr:CpsB/CapC family capsule biosynthesis tyrosine phosphatase [Salinimicrobium tongyeongense]UZH55493.1 histidinol phosphatase [Salinimicrobium tongyeongense]
MFSFFQKKIFLKDYLDGFIDIHNHVLPGIDDGASDVDTSISLLYDYQKLGIRKIIATPHVMNDYYANTPKSIRRAYDLLMTKLNTLDDLNIEIKTAAEYMMDQDFMALIEKKELLCLKEDMVLVEMSYFQPPINLNEILFQLQTQQYKPILAHPERYAFLHSNSLRNYKELKDRGCLFQLNALSLVGHYGKNMKDIAYRLLEEKMIDFIGTDTHQARHLEKLSTASISSKKAEILRPIIDNTKKTFVF